MEFGAFKKKLPKFLLPGLLGGGIIIAGVLTGWVLVRRGGGWVIKEGATMIQGPKEIGIKDEKLFPDSAVGVIEAGGINGEGTHKLIREGGPSQIAYLTSSVIDLDQFVGKKVQVWGETFKGQKAAWLMDVGRVKILE